MSLPAARRRRDRRPPLGERSSRTPRARWSSPTATARPPTSPSPSIRPLDGGRVWTVTTLRSRRPKAKTDGPHGELRTTRRRRMASASGAPTVPASPSSRRPRAAARTGRRCPRSRSRTSRASTESKRTASATRLRRRSSPTDRSLGSLHWPNTPGAWLSLAERRFWEPKVGGSNPPAPTLSRSAEACGFRLQLFRRVVHPRLGESARSRRYRGASAEMLVPDPDPRSRSASLVSGPPPSDPRPPVASSPPASLRVSAATASLPP